MKSLFLYFLVLLCCNFSFAQDVWVGGHYRNDGSYVQGHYRTHQNNTISDNYSTVGNVNPYTGKHGTVPMDYSYVKSSYPTPSPSMPTINIAPEKIYIPNTPTLPLPGRLNKEYVPTPKSNYEPPTIEQTLNSLSKSADVNTSTVVKGGKYFKTTNGMRNYVKQTLIVR